MNNETLITLHEEISLADYEIFQMKAKFLREMGWHREMLGWCNQSGICVNSASEAYEIAVDMALDSGVKLKEI